MPISSNEYARRPLLPRPISTSAATIKPFAVNSGVSLSALVVRGLDRHLDIVRVALLETRGRDLYEAAVGLQLRHGPGAGVPHGLAEAADQLVGDRVQRATVGHLALDALGD